MRRIHKYSNLQIAYKYADIFMFVHRTRERYILISTIYLLLCMEIICTIQLHGFANIPILCTYTLRT